MHVCTLFLGHSYTAPYSERPPYTLPTHFPSRVLLLSSSSSSSSSIVRKRCKRAEKRENPASQFSRLHDFSTRFRAARFFFVHDFLFCTLHDFCNPCTKPHVISCARNKKPPRGGRQRKNGTDNQVGKLRIFPPSSGINFLRLRSAASHKWINRPRCLTSDLSFSHRR